jgi:hypothetical protein
MSNPFKPYYILTFVLPLLLTVFSVELADVLEEYNPLMPPVDPNSDSDSTMNEFRSESPTITTARRRLFFGDVDKDEHT